ncbi:formylglycine-generating enzyme family protein [Cupriavidus sp. AcVe19-1a]|uniref:formylglycine-generating enzyme family protein n=1 Tax=Cupriavidus sp. AcVe19-1a TaxID=2821359 RepID=UPI001AE2C982|nr:formylglycine-generating enzyme family protein [Cupriavidus sp. AcVe19-1a]MBP0630532.1 formylglycine-generating enzyme family protein [Cupriavidus sp. AcVe19-1a]
MKRVTRLFGGVAVMALIAAAGWIVAVDSGEPEPGQLGDGVSGPVGMVWIPTGDFQMGSSSERARQNERPAHKVRLKGFWMDQFHVTNREFSAFVRATGYVTTAERRPSWESLRAQMPLGTPRLPDSALVPGGVVFVGTNKPVSLADYSRWWRYVAGASWRHPAGPGSTIEGKDEHPVVQVSYEDVLAYAKWMGKRLPTEAEWEYAARGGLEQATYAWGNLLKPDGKTMGKTWDEGKQVFPVQSQSPKILPGTAPVGLYPANGYSLHDMAGNAWQWVADWYRADAFARQASASKVAVDPAGPSDSFDPDGIRPDAPKRVIRGGSFLCSEAYCEGYRISARQGQDPYSSSSNIGFRLVIGGEEWRTKAR